MREDDDDVEARTVHAALALASILNACKEVPGEPRCEHLDALRIAGWDINFEVDDDGGHIIGFHVKIRPPLGDT